MLLRTLPITLAVLLWAGAARALDHVTLLQNGKQTPLAGRIEVEAEDGGVLLLTPDGLLWPIPKEEIAARGKDEKPFAFLSREELAEKLLAELPGGFKTHSTRHYLICHNTSSAYAQWVGSLYERLFGAFYNYWERRGMKLQEPAFPLVALVFDNRDSYVQFARGDVGEAAASMIGYYSLRTNRMISYDLTGIAEQKGAGERGLSTVRINQLLSQPGAERTVATIVHEATHQLAFNSGQHVRYADIPFWVSEGVAIYFETPDFSNSKGWRKIGGVNRVNLVNFRKLVQSGRPTGLESILTDDKRFRDPATAADAYAQAWALTYFLLQRRSDQYSKYLEILAAKTPLVELPPDERLAEFKRAFGDDLPALEAEFLRYMRTVN
jgi:hypothetical protein